MTWRYEKGFVTNGTIKLSLTDASEIAFLGLVFLDLSPKPFADYINEKHKYGDNKNLAKKIGIPYSDFCNLMRFVPPSSATLLKLADFVRKG